MDKKLKKHTDKQCHFCGENNYNALAVHRIKPESEGGKYKEGNCVVVCANCHQRIHAGEIMIEGRYFTSAGKYILHYFKNGEEFWS